MFCGWPQQRPVRGLLTPATGLHACKDTTHKAATTKGMAERFSVQKWLFCANPTVHFNKQGKNEWLIFLFY